MGAFSMRKSFSRACFAIAVILSVIGALFLGFEKVACDAGQYTLLQDRLDLYDEIGVSREEMAPAMEAIAAYIRGEADEYNRNVVMFGENRPLFNERELLHMVDVAGLFRVERFARSVCLAAAALFAAVGLWLGRGHLARCMGRGLLYGFGVLSLIAGFFAVLFWALDFEEIFIEFHHVFFTNDLWQMYYDTDAMIRMFPQPFFETLVSLILVKMGQYAVVCLLLWAGLSLLLHILSRKPHETR